MKRWVTTRATTLTELLKPHGIEGEQLRAVVAGGRVFVGRLRVAAIDQYIDAGEEVFVFPEAAHVDLPDPFVLTEAAGLIAVHKPAGLSTIPDQRSKEGCLLDRLASTRGIPLEQLHATSRLDREVSGVVVVATDAPARDLAALARTEGKYQRRYVALVEGAPPDRFEWTWSIARATTPRLRRAAPPDDPSALPARTVGRVVARSQRAGREHALLALVPQTGRTHQLRVHAAAAKVPMIGDVDYGAARRIVLPTGRVLPFARVALHCARVEFPLDLTTEGGRLPRLIARAAVPIELRRLGDELGLGEIEEAATCEV